jgi:pimeloyl-ACP methyl ester carboxylesterase
MTIALASGVLAVLILPFLLPSDSSGTKTAAEAAGPDAAFIELAGLQVHVERQTFTGDCDCVPPLIVLMHGFGASTFSWREVLRPLGEYGDVISYDRPAFGFTERPTEWGEINPYSFKGNLALLDELLEKYGKSRRVILVGHSAGGQLAAEFARQNPAKVNSLILVDPAILTTGGAPDGLDWFFKVPQIAKLGPILVSSIASSGDEVIRQSFYDQSKLTKDIFDGYHRPLQVRGWEQAFWNFATAPKTNDLAQNLQNLKLPILLITGSSDTIVPTSDTVRLNGLLKGSKLDVIEKSGHLPHEEQPSSFLGSIDRHWDYLND